MDSYLFGVFGVALGAFLHYLFTINADNKRHLRDLQSNAYKDYLKCVSECAHYSAEVKEKSELFMRAADAKTRICLYGSISVIEALAVFRGLGEAISDDKQEQAFTEMISIMRMDSGSKSASDPKKVAMLLYGSVNSLI